MPKHLRGSCIYLCLLFVVIIYLHERKKIEFMTHESSVSGYIFFRPITRLHCTGIMTIYLKNSAHFCLGVCSLQLTRSQVVAEVARVSQVQAMLELSQSTQTEAGAQAPAPVHWSSPPCSWALRGAWSNTNAHFVNPIMSHLEAGSHAPPLLCVLRVLIELCVKTGHGARAEVGDEVSVEDVGGAGDAGQGLAYHLAHQSQPRPLSVLGAVLACGGPDVDGVQQHLAGPVSGIQRIHNNSTSVT